MNVKRNSLAPILIILSLNCQTLAADKCLNVIKSLESIKEDLRITDNVDDVYVPSKKELKITGEALLLSIDNYYGPKKHKE